MTQAILVGSYSKESEFIQKLNEVLLNFSYDNLDIKYQTVMNGNGVLYSALVIIKDCR